METGFERYRNQAGLTYVRGNVDAIKLKETFFSHINDS